MFKTIFGKIMVLFMAIIMISLYISGLMMSQLIRQSYLTDSEERMKYALKNAAWVVDDRRNGYINDMQLSSRLNDLAINEDCAIWWIQWDGLVKKYGNNSRNISTEQLQHYYDDMFDELIEQEVSIRIEEDKATNASSTPTMTVACTLYYENLGIEHVFVHNKLNTLNTSLMNVYRQLVLSIAVSGILAIFVTYIFTNYLLRPLSIVTKGAKQLARGHFDIQLEVRSQDEIGQLADTFTAVAQDLKKYEQTRDSFVANVSHELRSPLTSMQGLLQGVIDGTIPENEQLHYLDIVLDETKRLNGLITNMLNLAKMESGQFPLQMEELDINELLRRALITFESKIDIKNLMVEVEFESDNQMVLADKSQIMQVIQNLMDNAIKFADYNGRLRISSMSTGDEVYISINNTGTPIPRSDLPYLFDRFYKGDASHTRTREGTGIGLSIVKRILEEHRQKIWVESDDIGGTTFTFTLPKTQADKNDKKLKPKK